MEMSPQRVRTAEFKAARKGADVDEVKAFLNDVADELERAQNQSTAMEARARAAVARLQSLTDEGVGAAPGIDAAVDEAATISRTLLLAQRTADTAMSEARAEAARIVAASTEEATSAVGSARAMAEKILDEARAQARQAAESERIHVASEVDALKARRDFLESDVEQLELFLADQRNRLREAATSLVDIIERVPGGLGSVRAPLLSASDEASIRSNDAGDDSVTEAPGDDGDNRDLAGDVVVADVIADVGTDDLVIATDIADEVDRDAVASDPKPAFDERPTGPMPVLAADDTAVFRFSFDEESR